MYSSAVSAAFVPTGTRADRTSSLFIVGGKKWNFLKINRLFTNTVPKANPALAINRPLYFGIQRHTLNTELPQLRHDIRTRYTQTDTDFS